MHPARPRTLTLRPTARLRGQLTVGAECSLGTGRKDLPGQRLHSPEVAGAPWSRQTLVAQSPRSAHAPETILLCTLLLHQAPGRQRACPDPGGLEADAKGAARHSCNWKTNSVSAADVPGLVCGHLTLSLA